MLDLCPAYATYAEAFNHAVLGTARRTLGMTCNDFHEVGPGLIVEVTRDDMYRSRWGQENWLDYVEWPDGAGETAFVIPGGYYAVKSALINHSRIRHGELPPKVDPAEWC